MPSIAVKLDMMQTLGPAPRAFFIDFTNALIITIFIGIAG